MESSAPWHDPLNTARRLPPSNTIRHATSNSSMSMLPPISSAEVVELARQALKIALEENESKVADGGVSSDLKPGVTIDLSHKNIQRFPEEVIDVIKNEIERLALSHNQISSFPARFSECTSLRYLNVRNNLIREFPPVICELTSLEILDLGRNKLRILPPDLAKLTSLKVLSIQRNRVEDLPLFLADMTSLQVLKLDGNPLRFPPKEVIQVPVASPPNGTAQDGNESSDLTITAQVKKFLRQKAISDRSETESGGEESSEGTETPRPLKRVTSGRFPIKVNGTDVPDLRSPAFPRPPPIPSRSHYRGLSQQNAPIRRPGVMPLTIGNANERLRSNSESLLQVTRDRSADRSRRMGIVSRKLSELGTVDELKINRFSHYRGLSHGSAMNGTSVISSANPSSPADSASQRPGFVRRLSSLPERKRESASPDPVIEGAKGMLYALFQVHSAVQSLLDLTRDPIDKRSSLQGVFYNATTHIEELDRHLQDYITYSEEDEESAPRSNENVHRACLTCITAYTHVCSLLSRNVETLVENADPRYIRTLLLMIYGSLAEIRNAGASLFPHGNTEVQLNIEDTIKAQFNDKSITPTRERPGNNIRGRSATVVHQPTNLRVGTDLPPLPYLNGGRSATMTSATPRSGESFSSIGSTGKTAEFSEEDRLFEKIFLRLQHSCDLAIKNLPGVNNHFVTAMQVCGQQSNPDQPKQYWQVLIQKCSAALQAANLLRGRLSLIKLNEPGTKSQSTFWELCNSFINAYADLAMKVKEAKNITSLLPNEVIILLRPLQKALKESSQLIQTSPWAFLASPQANNTNGYRVRSPASQVPLPMTPQSAALGPAVQATVPSTPQTSTYNPTFSSNMFERPEAWVPSLNSGFSSTASSRAGTMTSSINDGSFTPATTMSPMSAINTRYINGKVVF
ncbi:RAM signaling pathway protein-domain-containing protein [Xylogone sp. PMI_703]|nr:RAM signaling pathway protein-domain-containing protein [Xylogone sp. PMI_703]